MADHILVLGAGASLGARDSLRWSSGQRPPLGDGLGAYLQHWVDANGSDDPTACSHRRNPFDAEAPGNRDWADPEFRSGLLAFLAKSQAETFERATAELVDKYGEPGWGWINFSKINRTLAFSMLTGRHCAFPEAPDGDLYDDLLDGLSTRYGQSQTVITFNYDILFEEAVARRAGTTALLKAVHYPELRVDKGDRGTGLSVFKPHGSVNWLAVANYMAVGSNLQAVREQIKQPAGVSYHEGKPLGGESHQEYVPPGGRKNVVLTLKQSTVTDRPVMALYGPGKPGPVNAPGLYGVRSGCLHAVQETPDADVTIIGLRVPPVRGDDPVLDDLLPLLGQSRGRRLYVSPSVADCARAESKYGLEPRQVSMSEYIREELGAGTGNGSP